MSPSDDAGTEEYLIVARVRRPHGVRGEVLVALETDRPKHVFRPGRAMHLGRSRGEPTGSTVTLEGARATTGGMILRFRDVNTREAAAELGGHMLLIPAAEAQPAARDEIHYRDLVGMKVVAIAGPVGIIDDILELPTVEMLVVRSAEGKEILIPFVREMVKEVDVAAGVLRVELPEGLLEI